MCANFKSASGVEPSKAQAEQDEFYQPPLLKPTEGLPKNKNRLFVVLCDQTHDEGDRIAWPPDELFRTTSHPNVVLFRLQWAGDADFELHGLCKKFRGVGWFIVLMRFTRFTDSLRRMAEPLEGEVRLLVS
jgi:hypothetical protein